MEVKVSGRSKRDIPLPIFKNEPMGRNNEYKSTVWDNSEGERLRLETFAIIQ
jgi:hypothetical protein